MLHVMLHVSATVRHAWLIKQCPYETSKGYMYTQCNIYITFIALLKALKYGLIMTPSKILGYIYGIWTKKFHKENLQNKS